MNPLDLIFILSMIPVAWAIGAVINVLADDLPHTNRLTRPHFSDGSPRPANLLAWSGLGAYLTRQHRSPNDPTLKLSLRHPLTEIGMIVLYTYTAWAFPVTKTGPQLVFLLCYIFILMLITVIDLEHRLILFIVIIPGCAVALLGSLLTGRLGFQDYLIGGIGGFAVFFLMYLGGILFTVVVSNMRGEELEEVAFGYGDVLLAMLSGFMLGWQALIFALFITVFVGAAGALIFLFVQYIGRGKYEMFTALPYGQYIVIGTLIMLIWRDPIRVFLQGGG
jgi:leader peptidase (prepilin peptidase)/N-methyltransferase